MPAFGMPRSWGRHEGDTREKRGLCGISMKSFLEDTLISLQERCRFNLHGVFMAGEYIIDNAPMLQVLLASIFPSSIDLHFVQNDGHTVSVE